jgi:hypothetical protein
MNEPIDKLMGIAIRSVGVRAGVVTNSGTRIVEYQGPAWLQPGAWPWCAGFTCWIMRELLEDDATREYLREYFNRPTFSFAEAEKLRCVVPAHSGGKSGRGSRGFRFFPSKIWRVQVISWFSTFRRLVS